jgi:hypothetical protein
MGDRLLTHTEKNAIRNSPCGKCGAVPPLPDGSRCQVHRIIPESKGGRYTRANTVPRCPTCHTKEPSTRSPGWIMMSQAKHRELGLKNAARIHRLYPDLASQTMRRTNRRYPNLASEAGKKGGRAATVTMRAKYTPEQLSVLKRQAAQQGNHNRWHVRRGVRDPNCPLCKKGGV